MRLTQRAHSRISKVLGRVRLPQGVGGNRTEDGKVTACSIAAINLALTGMLVDDIPDCMNKQLGRWIINVQDQIGFEARNSDRWRNALPFAAGTAGSDEKAMFNAIAGVLAGHIGDHTGLREALQRARDNLEQGFAGDAWTLLAELVIAVQRELEEKDGELACEALEKALAEGYVVVPDEERTEQERKEDEYADQLWEHWLHSLNGGEMNDGEMKDCEFCNAQGPQ